MGACFSTDQSRRRSSSLPLPTTTRANTTSRSDSYNKLILEHLEKNKENFEVIAKSISALSAVNLNNSNSNNNNTPALLIRSNQSQTNPISNNLTNSNTTNTNVNETQCNCKCNCRASSTNLINNETLLTHTEKLKPKLHRLNKKYSVNNDCNPASVSKSNIRSINFVDRLDAKHKRYLIEVSDSYFSDFNYNKNSSLSSNDLTSSSEQRVIYRSFTNNLNKKMNKITKLKSKTQNEINCKNCENNNNTHYYDEINHLSYLDCSTTGGLASSLTTQPHETYYLQHQLHRNHHHNHHNHQRHHNQYKRNHINRKSLTTFDNHHPFNCKQCCQLQKQHQHQTKNKNQEIKKLASKNKSYSTNTIKFKDVIDEDFYYDDDDLVLFNNRETTITPTKTASTTLTNNKEVNLNKSETINSGTFFNNNTNNNSNIVTKLNTNFHADVENDYEKNFNHINVDNLEEEVDEFSNGKNSQNSIIKQAGNIRKKNNNFTQINDKISRNNTETTSSISSFYYINSSSDNLKNQTCQTKTSLLTQKQPNKFADYSIDRLSITFSSFSSTSSSSSTASLNIDFNNSLSLSNSAKSIASSKTLTQLEKMSDDVGLLTQVEITKQVSPDDQSQTQSVNSDKLKLQNVIDSVGFLLFPSAKFVNQALKDLLIENSLFDLFQTSFKTEFASLFTNSSQLYMSPNERLIEKTLVNLFNLTKSKNDITTKFDLRLFVRKLGACYFKQLFVEYEKSFLSLGGTVFNFFNNISSLHESLINHEQFGARFLYLNDKYTGFAPSFRADLTSNQFVINVYSIQEKKTHFLTYFYLGLIDSVVKLIWNLDIQCEKIKKLDLNFNKFESASLESFLLGYKLTLKNPSQLNYFTNQNNSAETVNSIEYCLSDDLFKSTFPFMILIDRELNIVQIGDSLVRSLGQAILNGNGCQFFSYFSIEEPRLNDYSFDSLILNQNMNFKLKMKASDNKMSQMKEMLIKGSIIYENESDCLLFLGSPVILSLDELTDRGMYISDIPIHDAVRDIILVGEQTKAQEGLKFRMEKLKKSILKAHEDIDVEKRKNIELLNMIFPSDIAEKLWMGHKVNARNVENVTLLYSDIVGFTSICSSAEPIEIVKMLKNIYTEFDNFCGLVDVYKIETIGDAYIVAAGLHKSSKYHAQRAAWMSLLMLDVASKNYTNKNEKIKMRIGLHTGDVLAGIVGIKQPRYCLFGNNCTIANKFESNSEENRIHVSPVTKALLDSTKTFEMEPRSVDYLPDNWTSTNKEKEITWFLNDYKHKSVPKENKCLDHIKAALNDLDEHLNQN